MKHEDFTSIQIEDVLTKTLNFAFERTGASGVHWLSAHGLDRVRESTKDNWQWAFASASVVGHHLWSQPACDMHSLYQLWSQIPTLFPKPWTKRFCPQMMSGPLPQLVYPVYTESKLLGILVIEGAAEKNPVALIGQVQAGLEVAAKYLDFAYQHLSARNETYLDELTGLYNQRYLPMALDHEINRSKRDKSAFTLLFLDIDYFKMVNDGRGHLVGSRLLIEVGQVLKGQVRDCDYCFRYGGDEFIVLLSNADAVNSKIVAERIRQAVEQKTFQVEGHSLSLTVSIGLASYPTHAQTASGLIHLADQAMYYGKRKSRNVVFVAS